MDENKKMEMRDVSRLLEESYVAGSGNVAAGQKGDQNCLKDSRGSARGEIPYPGLEGIGEDPAALKIIAPAYAGGEGELTAVLQYIYQHIIFENSGYPEYADTLLKISLEEMKHLARSSVNWERRPYIPICRLIPSITIVRVRFPTPRRRRK